MNPDAPRTPELEELLIDAEADDDAVQHSPPPTSRPWLLLLGLVLVALNLRPALSSLSPLLSEVSASLGLSAARAGLLTTLPVLCLFFYRPCDFSGFGRSLGGISGSLTGVFGGGILPFDGLLLLPAGKRVAGKLGIFLQRFLVQNIYICLFQLTLCLCCFAVRLQLVAAIALPHQISAGLHRLLGLVGAFHAHIVLFCFPDLFVKLARDQMDGSFLNPLRKFGRWFFLVLKGQLRGLFPGVRVNDRLSDFFLWNIGLRLICSGRSFLRFADRLFQCRVSPFLISKAQARLFIQTNHPLG